MINYNTLQQSESFRRPYSDDTWHSVVLLELHDGYIVKDHLPCYFLVGVSSYISYQDRLTGAILHFDNQKDAEKKYSELCERYSVKEEEVFGV